MGTKKKRKATAKKKAKPSTKKHEIAGHSIHIKKEGGAERLFIDGKQRKYIKNDAGYVLRDNIYEKPHKTLIEAVKIYCQSCLK